MNNCPSEIWLKIFSLACRDDGLTGRSLSLVSKYIHNVSSTTKYQSLKVQGLNQMLGCARVLESTPAVNRRVRYLFLSTVAPSVHELDSSKLPSQEAIDPILYEDQIYDAMLRILNTVASSVQVLYIMFTFHRRLLLPPMSLPVLSELTLYGPFPDDESNEIVFEPFPSLRRLHLANIPYYPSDQRIPSIAPSLTHLRISARESDFLDFIRRLARAFSTLDATGPQIKLPDTIQRVLFEPSLEQPSFGGGWFMSSYQYLLTMEEIWQVARVDDRLVVIDTRNLLRSRWSFHEAEADWIERINGGQGCWKF